jgi:hypothetical protein
MYGIINKQFHGMNTVYLKRNGRKSGILGFIWPVDNKERLSDVINSSLLG